MKILKPSFFIIGAAKAATTSLAKQLGDHPEIYIPPKKELVFFNYHRLEAASVARYEEAFRTPKAAVISGEASPQYSFGSTFPFCASRMATYCSQAKIIYLVRDPVARLQSHVLQIRNWGGAGDESVQKIIQKYPQVLEASMYGSRLRDYLRYFNKNQIMVIQFEKLVSDAANWLPRVCEFLGVAAITPKRLVEENTRTRHYEDRRIMRGLRGLGLGHVGRWLPRGPKSRLIHAFKRPQTEIPHIPENDARCLQQLLREDAQTLFIDWGLDESLWTYQPLLESGAKTEARGYGGDVRLD